jgi:hypothetical protein
MMLSLKLTTFAKTTKQFVTFNLGHAPEGGGVMYKCTTHHHACECREKLMQYVCRELLNEHHAIRKFSAGFGAASICECPACKAARKLYPDLTADRPQSPSAG